MSIRRYKYGRRVRGTSVKIRVHSPDTLENAESAYKEHSENLIHYLDKKESEAAGKTITSDSSPQQDANNGGSPLHELPHLDFSEEKFNECSRWIAETYNNYQKQGLSDEEIYNKIYNLNGDPSSYSDNLEQLIDYSAFPEDVFEDNVKIWHAYVDYYRETHKKIAYFHKGIPSDQGDTQVKKVPDNVNSSAWLAYKKTLISKMSEESIGHIEESSIWTLNHLKNDTRDDGPVKGLVTGSVQSGKTANMVGVISMAADYDFNFFILLSGTIENLRRQTQGRLKHDLQNTSGITWKILDFSNEEKRFPEKDLLLSDLERYDSPMRYVTVCLKNSSRLKKLIHWLYTDPNVASRLRIVVIDDEADQAGVNTYKIVNDPDQQERKAINQLIIDLVNGKDEVGEEPKNTSFQAVNYISYTATPYANILNESGAESLYPRDFIYALEEPKEYFGISVIFGNTELNRPGLDIINTIPADDAKALKKGDVLSTLPKSLKDSIAWFLCSAALLRHRNYKKNMSMLVHTSSNVDAQYQVYSLIRKWLVKDKSDVLQYCSDVYEFEHGRITKESIKEANPEYGLLNSIKEITETFDEIRPEINGLIKDIKNIEVSSEKGNDDYSFSEGINICLDNSKAQKYTADPDTEHLRIDYPNDEQLKNMNKAPAFIVVGGNTLARGLTLEGLMCTYFSRDSNQADSLMQMGRWFGYRKNIELLQRIWLTEAEEQKFRSMAKMDYEMKKEIDRFVMKNLSPADFGPKLYTMPEIAKFRLTAANKMQKATGAEFDFEGYNGEITDYDDDSGLQYNVKLFKNFLATLPSCEITKHTGATSFVYRNVPANKIIHPFFDGPFHISQYSSLLKIKNQFLDWLSAKMTKGEYTSWNVAVIQGTNKEDPWVIAGNQPLYAINRTKKNRVTDHIDIGSLRSGVDALCDVDVTQLDEDGRNRLDDALKSKKNLVLKRNYLGLKGIPLLLLYRIKKDGGKDTKYRSIIHSKSDIIGFSVIISGLEASDYTSFVRVEKMD